MIHKLLDAVKSKRKVLIQTHNNPDPDTIASAFALKNLLTNILKKRVTIAYMGIIGRTENKEMVKTCKIDMYLMSKLNIARYDYFIVVDTQPGAGNVYSIEGRKPDAIIDHHNLRPTSTEYPYYDIRSSYGSTSTIIAEYYKALNIIPDTKTATALYYGIKTDIFGAGRGNTQADMDMMSFVYPYVSANKLTKIESPDLPRYYFKNIKKAIEHTTIIDNVLFCNLEKVRNADLIAEMSDFLLRMRNVKCSFVIGLIDDTCYFSLRHKTSKKSIGQIAIYIVKGIGYGGGHMKSAGGQVPLKRKTYDQVVSTLKSRLLKRLRIKNIEEKSI